MEIWDLYDASRAPLGVTHPRGRQYPLPAGTYHLVVYILTVSADGRLLLTRRAPTKRAFPGFFEFTGGSGVAGEDSLTAARRELCEETGLSPSPEAMTRLAALRIPEAFADVYLVRLATVAEATAVTLQEGETVESRWVTFYELERHIQRGEIPPTGALVYGAVRAQLMALLPEALWLCPMPAEEDGSPADGEGGNV